MGSTMLFGLINYNRDIGKYKCKVKKKTKNHFIHETKDRTTYIK